MFCGKPIHIEFQPQLRVSRGKLVSGGTTGTEVHAGSFLAERRIVLDRALLRTARERDRILAHELFHFVWWKLGPRVRAGYESLISGEHIRGLPGELGWSAESRKSRLREADYTGRTRRFRQYLCESFCDTAAVHLGAFSDHEEITLGARAQRARRRWMQSWFEDALCRGGFQI